MSDIFNGARCKTYSWSQSHGDLEIRSKIPKSTKQDQICVALSKVEVRVTLTVAHEKKTILEGHFEHEVDTESAFWVIEDDGSHLAIFIDKAEEMWWKKLLKDEQVSEQGPQHFTVPMDHLDEGARSVIDKLVDEQRRKTMDLDGTESFPHA